MYHLTGQKFNMLTVVSEHGRAKGNKVLWLCLCDCGKNHVVESCNLRNGHTKSCGCLRIEAATKHGLYGTPEYRSWAAMHSRCKITNKKDFSSYAGRGIVVCDRWYNVENFVADMGKKRSPDLTIERRDNDKGYDPDNCYWATRKQQNRNTRIREANTTGINGVTFLKRTGKYIARIRADVGHHNLGSFETIPQAAEARRQGEIKYWGQQEA